MAFTKKIHPLGWGDKELKYLISTGMNNTNLYRAMGGTVKPHYPIPKAFKERVEKLTKET